MTAAAGTDDFTIATYDVAPSSAGFLNAAHQLGVATLTSISIVSGLTNTVNVALGGVVSSVHLSGQPSVYGPAAATFALTVSGLDVDGNTIVAGTNTVTNGTASQTDTYANPITVSVTESGGSGHAKLSLNGGASQTAVTVTKSSDAVTFNYDGNATGTYFATVATSASNATGANARVSALFLSGAGGGTFTGGTNPVVTFSGIGQTETLTLIEPNFGGTFTATLAAPSAACPANSIALNPAGLAGLGNTFTLSAGTVNATSCVVTVSDGTSSVQLVATDSVTGTGSVSLPVPKNVLYFTVFATASNLAASAEPLTPGPFVGPNAATRPIVLRYNLSDATTSVIAGASTLLVEPLGVAHDAAGNVYVADAGANAIFEFAAGAAGNVAPVATIRSTALAQPDGLALDAVGRIYVTDRNNGTVVVFAAGSSGASVTPFATIAVAGNPSGLALDSAGDVYVSTPNAVFEFAPPAAGSGAPLPFHVFRGAASPVGLALDPTGNLFIADASSNTVLQYSPTQNPLASPAQTFTTPFSVVSGIAVDGAGDLYVEGPGSSGNLTYQLYSVTTGLAVGPQTTVIVYNVNGVTAQLTFLAY